MGYKLSADYVASSMEAAGYRVSRQSFEYNFYEELAAPIVIGTSDGFPFSYTDGVNISTMDFSGSDTVEDGVVQGVNDNIVPLPVGQPDSTSNAGCEDVDFDGFTGDIALIQRGTCFFFEKIANGSGSAAQLEVAQEMAELSIQPVNQVRFIWFGAEEAGLVGSAFYVSQLPRRELKNIAVMLNFDMVGSPNAGWFVYDGDASDTISTGSTGSAAFGSTMGTHSPAPSDQAARPVRLYGGTAAMRSISAATC